MASANIKVGGTFRTATGIHVKVAGTWRAVQSGYIKVAGVWQQFWAAVTVAISDQNIIDSAVGAPAFAQYALANTGVASYATINNGSGNIPGEWLPSGTPANYDVRATLNSGSLDGSSSATGSWLNLGTGRAWLVQRLSAGVQAANLTIEIRDAGTLAVVDTATVVLSATYS